MLTFILLGRLTNLAVEQTRELQERDKRAAEIIKMPEVIWFRSITPLVSMILWRLLKPRLRRSWD